MINNKPNQTEFINVRNSKTNYKYDIQKAKKPISLQNQLGLLHQKALKSINNTLIIPKGLSLTNRIFYDELIF